MPWSRCLCHPYRTDGRTPQGRKPAPTAPLHPPQHTGHTRAPRPHRHTRHTRQAGQAHASAGRRTRHADTDEPPWSRCMCHRPSPCWTDGRTPSASTGHCRRPQRRHPRKHTRSCGRRGQDVSAIPTGRTDSTRCACHRGRQDGAILMEEAARQQGMTAYRNVPLNKIAVEMDMQ
ncbi:mCG1033818, partial [Mus musculus]